MIRRNASKLTPSLVNSANSEHSNVTHAIRDDSPITDLTSVASSVNFDIGEDGSYVLRNPVVLKRKLLFPGFFIYDKKAILNFNISTHTISLAWEYATEEGPDITCGFKYFDKDGVLHTCILPLNFFTNVYKHVNGEDATIFSALINRTSLDDHLEDQTLPSFLYNDTDISYGNSLYRLFKVVENIDQEVISNVTPDYFIVMVNTEPNSITSSLGSTSETLDVNLLLDNPYAIRDLYDYGSNTTTKILAYPDIFNNYLAHKVIELTEGLNENGGIIESINTQTYSNTVLLKAFITTSKQEEYDPLKYFCIWEYSDNGGIDWKPVLSFKQRFEDKLIKKYVSDLTSSDFDKKIYEESLESAASYLVEKELVPFPTNASVTDLIEDRPDVLQISFNELRLIYRFQVYVDTGKTSPVPETITSLYSLGYFDSLNSEFNDGKFEYTSLKGASTSNPELIHIAGTTLPTGNIRLNIGASSKVGNAIVIKSNDEKYKITKVSIYTGPSSKNESDETIEEESVIGFLEEEKTQAQLATMTLDSISDSLHSIKANNSLDLEVSNTDGIDACTICCGTDVTNNSLRISKINITYTVSGLVKTTTTYLNSFTGNFQLKQNNEKSITLLKNLNSSREAFFKGTFDIYDNQIVSYGKYNVFFSNPDSSIIKLSKTLTFGFEVTKVLPWRNYLLIFTEHTISIASYDYESDSYAIKLLTENVGISKTDANTATVILNTIYFKSKYRIYKMVPNLYASNDDILNLHIISTGINTILENIVAGNTTSNCFCYTDTEYYYVFVPTNSDETFCFKYQYTKKLWTVCRYPIRCIDIAHISILEEYLQTTTGLYYFNKNIQTILKETVLNDYTRIGCIDDEDEDEDPITYAVGGTVVGSDISYTVACPVENLESALLLYKQCPYTDYLDKTIQELYNLLNTGGYEDLKAASSPISFNIDFGQKSLNYTLDKQFLESKLIFATLQEKDTIPLSLDIETDGENMSFTNSRIHIDPNTSGALWKTNILDKGVLNTIFGQNTSTNYNGIMRQLIVKYSGKGKTIRHVISGKSQTLFKFYSLDSRYRVLSKKQ